MNRTAFVTGSTGFVGSHLVRELIRRGVEVTVLVRNGSSRASLPQAGVKVCVGDVTDPESLKAAVPRGVDWFFHVAASTSIWSRNNALQNQVNIGGTENVIEAARWAGAGRLVHTSSFIVWGFHDEPITEDTPWTAGDDWINYICSKREAERRVKAAVERNELDAVICNPAHILGPGDRHNWSRMVRLVHENRLPGVPPGGGAFADVREVARAHVAAAERGERGANYLLGGEDNTFLEVVQHIGTLLGRTVPGKPTSAWQIRLLARWSAAVAAVTGNEPDITPEGAAMITRHIHCDCSRAKAELGYRFTAVDQLLHDTIEWMRQENMLQ